MESWSGTRTRPRPTERHADLSYGLFILTIMPRLIQPQIPHTAGMQCVTMVGIEHAYLDIVNDIPSSTTTQHIMTKSKTTPEQDMTATDLEPYDCG